MNIKTLRILTFYFKYQNNSINQAPLFGNLKTNRINNNYQQQLSEDVRSLILKIRNFQNQLKNNSIKKRSQESFDLLKIIKKQIKKQQKVNLDSKNVANNNIYPIVQQSLNLKILDFQPHKNQILSVLSNLKCKVFLNSKTITLIIKLIQKKLLPQNGQYPYLINLENIRYGLKFHQLFKIFNDNIDQICIQEYGIIFQLVCNIAKLLKISQKQVVLQFANNLHHHIIHNILIPQKKLDKNNIQSVNIQILLKHQNFKFYLMMISEVCSEKPYGDILLWATKISYKLSLNISIHYKTNQNYHLLYLNMMFRKFPFVIEKGQLAQFANKVIGNRYEQLGVECQLYFMSLLSYKFGSLFKSLKMSLDGQFSIIEPYQIVVPQLSQSQRNAYKNIKKPTYRHSQVQSIMSTLYSQSLINLQASKYDDYKIMPKKRSGVFTIQLEQLLEEFNLKFQKNMWIMGHIIDYFIEDYKIGILLYDQANINIRSLEQNQNTCFRNGLLLSAGYKLIIINMFQIHNNRYSLHQLYLAKLKLLWQNKAVYVN